MVTTETTTITTTTTKIVESYVDANGDTVVVCEEVSGPTYSEPVEGSAVDLVAMTGDDAVLKEAVNDEIDPTDSDVMVAGDDQGYTLIGGAGDDTFELGAGKDVVVINLSDTSSNDQDVVKSFGSDDAIQIQDVLHEDYAPLTVTATQTDANVTLSVDSNGTEDGGMQQEVVIESVTTTALEIAIDTSLTPDLVTITKTGDST